MVKLSRAQYVFVEKVRGSVEVRKEKYFDDKDWMNIAPATVGVNHSSNQKISVQSYYVRPVAVWVPHLLVKNHMPSCPKCRCCTNVRVKANTKGEWEWVKSPLVMHGVPSHTYLDTVYYFCTKLDCYSAFTGYNQLSLQIDAKQYVGLFNIYLANRFAVHPDLYSYVISHSIDDSTAGIHRKLKQAATDKYAAEVHRYYHAVQNKRVFKKHDDRSAYDGSQQLITATFRPMTAPMTYAERHLKRPPNERITGAPWHTKRKERRQREQATTRVFRSKKYCTTCGFRRNKHVKDLECTNKPSWKCLRTYCARCGWKKEYHKDGIMGPNCCTNAPIKADCPTDWYAEKQCSITVVRKCK